MKEFDLQKHLDESEEIRAGLHGAAKKCFRRMKIFRKLGMEFVADYYFNKAIGLMTAGLALYEANLDLLCAMYIAKMFK